MPALTNARHELFAQEIARGVGAAPAYVTAGFKHNDGNARTLRANQAVAKRIQELLDEREAMHQASIQIAVEKTGITIGKVLEELAKIGFSNIADYVNVTGDDPAIALQDVPQDKLAALSEITTETFFDAAEKKNVRRVKIKLWDKKGALVDIGRHLGMFKERVELSGDPSNPIVQVIERRIVDPADTNGKGISPATTAR